MLVSAFDINYHSMGLTKDVMKKIFDLLDEKAVTAALRVSRLWHHLFIETWQVRSKASLINLISDITETLKETNYQEKLDNNQIESIKKISNITTQMSLGGIRTVLIGIRGGLICALNELNPSTLEKMGLLFKNKIYKELFEDLSCRLASLSHRKKILIKRNFPFTEVTQNLINEALTIPVSGNSSEINSGSVLSSMLLARTFTNELQAESPAWQEMQNLILKLNPIEIRNAFYYCFDKCVKINELSYCFLVLVSMVLNIKIDLPKLSNCDFSKLTDQINDPKYKNYNFIDVFFRDLPWFDLSSYPDQKRLITFLCTELKADLNSVASWAIKKNSKSLFEEIKMQAPKNHNWDYNALVVAGVKSRNEMILQFIIGKVPHPLNLKYQSIALAAIEEGNLKYLKVILKRPSNWDVEELYFSAAKSGHIDILKYLMKQRKRNVCKKMIAEYAAQSGSLEMFKFVMKHFSTHSQKWDYSCLAYYAASSGNLELVKYIIQLDKKSTLSRLAYISYNSSTIEILKYLMSIDLNYLMSIDLNSSNQGLKKLAEETAHNGHLEILQYIYSLCPKAFMSGFHDVESHVSGNRKIDNWLNNLYSRNEKKPCSIFFSKIEN